MTPRARLMRRAAITALLPLAVAACGVPTSESPTLVADDDVPFGLLSSTSTTSTTAPREEPAFSLTVCFYGGDTLVGAARPSPVVGVAPAIEALRDGPTAAERRAGLASAVFEPDVVLSAQRTGGVAHVELGESFKEVGATDQLRIIAQTVCTLTSLPGVGQVAFQFGGTPIDVPRGDGSLTAAPVSRDDYAQLLAR